MILWSIQPMEVYEIIQKDGVYRTDPDKIDMPEFLKAYAWMNEYLSIKDPKPDGVSYPVWGWYQFMGKKKKPDLRYNCYGFHGEKYACMELEIPDNKVLLSDFEAWHFVLNDWWFDNSDNREDYEIHEKWYDSQPIERQEFLKKKSWEQIFSLHPVDTDWTRRGFEIQGVFWELKKEYIKKVQFFTAR